MVGRRETTHRPARSGRASLRRMTAAGLAAVGAATVSACAGSSLPSLPKITELNPFAEKEKILPGKRTPVLPASASSGVGGADLAPASEPVRLPAPVANANWAQPGGSPDNAPGHLAFSGTGKRAWRADAGTGSGSRARLSAGPIAADGRVFTLDANATVSSFSAAGGQRGWRVSLVPEGENAREGYGGGLAYDAGRLFAATGFGTLVALDAKSGKKLWETNLRIPLRASPTAVGGRVYAIGSDGRIFCLAAENGSRIWNFRGLPQTTRLISNPSPAVSGGRVIVPYPSGDLVALNAEDGLTAWTDSLASTRIGGLGNMSDVSRPVIGGGVVYAAGHSGRLAAIKLDDGDRVWSLDMPGLEAPAVSGGYVFAVDVNGQLVAVQAKSGQVAWSVKLSGAKTWSGPTLASGRLWLTSNEGHLLSADAATGRVLSQAKVAAPIYIAPIVAGNRLFVLADDATLLAFN